MLRDFSTSCRGKSSRKFHLVSIKLIFFNLWKSTHCIYCCTSDFLFSVTPRVTALLLKSLKLSPFHRLINFVLRCYLHNLKAKYLLFKINPSHSESRCMEIINFMYINTCVSSNSFTHNLPTQMLIDYFPATVDLPEVKGSHRKFRTVVASLIGEMQGFNNNNHVKKIRDILP